MQSALSPSALSDLARLITSRTPPVRLLFVGSDAVQPGELGRQDEIESRSCPRLADLQALTAAGGDQARFDLVVWFYAAEIDSTDDGRFMDEIVKLSDELVIIPGPGANVSRRRPNLVLAMSARGFFPDYESEMAEFSPGALHLVRRASGEVRELLPAVERAFARLNADLRALERRLRTRLIELEAADRHIARLEAKLLQLKKAKKDLKQLKAEKQALRKSPERKIGQVLLAPYRLPQKLLREIRKRFPPSGLPRSAAPDEYQRWLKRHQATPAELARMREESRSFSPHPLISIITPVFNTRAEWLEQTIESVRQQAYENWELMLIDDGSTDAGTLRVLEKAGASDARIRVLHLRENRGISAASNAGIEAAKGDWIGLLDHDDLLEPDALYQTAKLLQTQGDADLIYSDEDKLTEEGYAAPFMKPDWSPDFFHSYNYLCHFTTIRRELVQELGGFRSEFDFAQDYDLYLRVVSRSPRIHHIPRVLYHWRRSQGSTSINIRAKPEALDAARGALRAHLERTGQAGHVSVDWSTHCFRIRRDLVEERRIAIIIPTRDRIDLLARCIASVEKKTAYSKYEIVIVNNDSQSEEARQFFRQTRHRVLHFSGPFNYSAINNFAVEQTDAPWILFLNNDAEVISDEWLTSMAEHVQRPKIGAVGAQLLFRDRTIQHAGIVLGLRGTAKHSFLGFPADSPGVCRQLQVTRNYSAVTAACLLTRREVFEEVGGFDEEHLPVIFNDVDLCLKMRAAGYLIVYTPYAKLYHDESASRRPSVEPIETEVLRRRWPEAVARDPYYNPNLSIDQADFSLGK